MLSTLKIISFLIIIPNLIAARTLSENDAYRTNKIYTFGYPLLILYNLYINEFGLVLYFIINLYYAAKGVIKYKKETLH
jgi:hypothetical protein